MPQCQECNKFFTSSSSYKYHISHQVCHNKTHLCDESDASSSQESNIMGEIHSPKTKIKLILKSKYERMSREELIVKLSQVEGKYEALKENPQNINHNNIIVFPLAFGKEDMDYVSHKLGDILGPLIRNHPFRCIPNLFNKIHNNEQLPEYHNVYISSERSNYALVSDGKSFKYRPKKTIIDQIIEDKRSILNRYIDDNGEQLGDKVLKKYEQYQNQIDDNSDFRKELEVEIGGMLLDMKSVIANDENTRQLLEKVNNGIYDIDM
jgi:hypothetical protein